MAQQFLPGTAGTDGCEGAGELGTAVGELAAEEKRAREGEEDSCA
jgi:hypothetical protein